MEVINHLMIQQTHDERIKYEEYLRKIEELKTEMESLYRLHPDNFVTKENGDDIARDCNLPFYLCRTTETLVIDGWETWGDEDRQKVISQNGNTGEHYYGEL